MKVENLVDRDEVPSESTVNRILKRVGLLQPRRKRRKLEKGGSAEKPTYKADRPNEVWTVDFKGWWLDSDKARVEPLTIRDAYARFVLAVDILDSTKLEDVIPAFIRVFEKYGVPKAILSDNGSPFVAGNRLGITQLSALWHKLGIEHIRTRPGKPQDNGAHERLHKDIAAELEVLGASLTKAQYKEAAERWRHDYNHHRPHEGIGMKRPADLYKRSRVEYSSTPIEHQYPKEWPVRRVHKRGTICIHNRNAFVSHALWKEELGLEYVEPLVYDVWFTTKKLGRIDLNKPSAKIRPISWGTIGQL